MSNRRELRNARRKADEAAASLEAIEALPRRRGQHVRWSNGVIWERAGADDWRPVAHTIGGVVELTSSEERERRFTSEHVAGFAFWPVTAEGGTG